MKNLYKIALKIAKDFNCANNQFNDFDRNTRKRLSLIAKSIVHDYYYDNDNDDDDDYDYIYDPDHVLNHGNGYKKTPEGWSKGTKPKINVIKKEKVKNKLNKHKEIGKSFLKSLSEIFQSGKNINTLSNKDKEKIFNDMNTSIKEKGGKEIHKSDFKEIFNELKKNLEKKLKENNDKNQQEQNKKEQETINKANSEKKRNSIISESITDSIKKEVAESKSSDFKNLFNETNRKLKENGLQEIKENDFRRIFNEIKFPMCKKSGEESYSMTEDEIKVFCEQHICEHSRFEGKDKMQTTTILNAIQTIKREFPDLHKTKMGAVGSNVLTEFCDYSQEVQNSAAAWAFFPSKDNPINGISFGDDNFDLNIDTSAGSSPYTNPLTGETFNLGTSINCIGGNNEFSKITAIHEMGHITKDNLRKIDEEKFNQVESSINQLFEESKKNGEIYDLSWYSSTEPEEFFAEVFSLYYHDKSVLPPNILLKFEKIIKDMKS